MPQIATNCLLLQLFDESSNHLTKYKMRRLLLILLAIIATTARSNAQSDSTVFHAYLENKEFEVYMRLNFYQQDIVIPGQEYYGPLPGYLGKENNPFCWVVIEAKLKDDRHAQLTMVNDYGSEDLTAMLSQENDSVYVLRQLSGSPIKIPRDRKWFKLPKTIELKRR